MAQNRKYHRAKESDSFYKKRQTLTTLNSIIHVPQCLPSKRDLTSPVGNANPKSESAEMNVKMVWNAELDQLVFTSNRAETLSASCVETIAQISCFLPMHCLLVDWNPSD